MGKGTKKIHGQLSFTIHYLQIGSKSNDPFQIEWKRGDSRGYTEKALLNDENNVTFEKNFRCSVTVYIDTKTGQKRPKLLQLTVAIFRDGTKRKVYGKLVVDVCNYFGLTTPRMDTLRIDSPHKKPSSITLSAIVTENSKIDPNTDLTSVLEDQLETDIQDEWDVSVAVTESDKQRIETFFEKRHEEKEKLTVQLSEFRKTPSAQPRPTPRNRIRPPSLNAPLMAAPGGLAGFLNSNKPQTNRPVIPKKQGFICSNSAARLSSLPPVDRKKKANSITLQDFNDEKAKDDEEVTPNLLNSLNLVPPSQMMEEEEKAEKEDKSEKKDKSKKKHKKHSKDKDKKEKKHKKHRKGKESKEEEETNEKEENEANSKGDTKPEENPETQQEEKSELEQEQEQTPEEPAQPEEPKKEEPAQPEEPQPAEIPKEEPKQEEPKKEEAPKIETKVSPKEAAREFLEKTTSRIWSQSPLDATKGIPKASAVLFAAIVESQILQTNKITDEKEFQEIADDFVSILKTRSVVERATLYDSLVVVLYLLKLIRGAEGDQNRKEYLSEKFAQEVCKPKFLEYIEENSIDLTSAAQCIVMCTVDNNSGISLIDLSMERILTKDPMFNGMKEAVKQMAIQLFDIQLLKNLLDNDYQIRFGNAVMWNQMFSVVNEEKNIDFTMFREAIGVMMMAQGICANPEVMIDVAPHLTPQFVYKVMESELPDDCLPLSNDTTTFVAFFNIDKSRSPEVSVFNYYDDFSEMIIDFPDNWRDVKVTFEDVKAFPFLSKYFKDEK